MTIQGVKANVLKTAGAAVLAGAVFFAAAPTKAQAQQFAVGVQFGAPAYGYAYGPGPGYEAHLRWERERERAAIARHEAWEREQEWRRHEDWRYRGDGRYGFGSGYVPRAVPYGGWR